jgi:CheY-like chemotaxis protein
MQHPPPGTREGERTRQVLLVEDDASVRSTLAAILEDEGWQIVSVSNGFDALASLEQLDPDVIVLDWMMPVVDGEKFLQALREDQHRDTPVLVISAGRIPEESARTAGADAYLRKPFDIDDLLAVVRQLASGRHRDGS